MFQRGQIVYHNQVIFKNNILDTKSKRPCVVLLSVEYGENTYVLTCPFTSKVRTFNKKPDTYKFISEQLYSYKKLCFANIESTRLYPLEETHETPFSVSEETVNSIISAIYNLSDIDTNMTIVKTLLAYDHLFAELEQSDINRTKKLERINKRKYAKGTLN